MEKKSSPVVDAARGMPRVHSLSPPRGDIVLDRSDRRLSTVSKISVAVAIALIVLGWTIGDDLSRVSPLLGSAVLFLLGAAVAGAIGHRRPALHADLEHHALEKKQLTESAQELLLDLGLLGAVAWLVELMVRVLAWR